MPGAGGIPGAGYGRARTGAVCARDGPRPGAAGIGLPGDADEERSRAQVPGSGMLLRKDRTKKAPVIATSLMIEWTGRSSGGGANVFQARWAYDGSAQGGKKVAFGNYAEPPVMPTSAQRPWSHVCQGRC
jgi:hypothetical protein